MKRAWLGLAMLSGAWLLGLGYYQAAQMNAWRAVVIAGIVLLIGQRNPLPRRGAATVALLILLPALLWVVDLPSVYLAGPAVFAIGLLLTILPMPASLRAAAGGAGLLAGAILIVQSLAMLGYETWTARSHELPPFLPPLLAGVASLLNIDAAASGTHIAMHTMRVTHMLGATWELLLDPASFCLLVGGIVLIVLRGHSTVERSITQQWLKPSGIWLLIMVIWLPLRAGLLMAIFIHRALRVDYDTPLNLMNQFYSPWVHLGLLAIPVLMAWRFVRLPLPTAPAIRRGLSTGPKAPVAHSQAPKTERAHVDDITWGKRFAAILCIVFGIAVLTAAVVWDPIGERKAGRLMVDEYHSDWERTDRPYDTEWYGQRSGYNYACIYDYLGRFYETSRLVEPITDEVLKRCDMLMIKTPCLQPRERQTTLPGSPTPGYSDEEVAAIEQFVRDGGGLLLIGEHTNVFGTGTYLNQIARRFGFAFRDDCLFSISGSPFEQLYTPGFVPHPVVQHMPPMDFAVSCSIDPGFSAGRPVIRSIGMKNLPADYHVSNFYPQVTDRAEGRYGAFVQLWSTRAGQGRVLGFTDSTIFSNFSTFEPGKAELMLGMVEWLNHRHRLPDLRIPFSAIGLALLVAGLVILSGWPSGWVVMVSAGILGWATCCLAVRTWQPGCMTPPRNHQPMVRVVIDRTLCDGPLSKGGFIKGEDDGFGIFERWILRLGYFNQRASGTDALTGDLLVMMYPRLPVSNAFRQQVTDYVQGGGKLLVLDDPANNGSTTNELLDSFGLKVDHSVTEKGRIETPKGWPPGVPVESGSPVVGGTPLFHLNGTPVAAEATYGRGKVVVIGFGSRFSDPRMGVTGDIEPEEQLRQVFDLQFALLRWLVEAALNTEGK